MWQWFVFLIGSLLIIWLSRGSLRRRDAHGFYRFFAFEAILGLIVLNAPVWFSNPFAPRQLASWALLLVSLLLAAHGFYMLRRVGQPDRSIEDSTRLGIEKTTRLVRTGAYRFIRHPLYASLLLLAAGAFLKTPSLIEVIVLVLVVVSLVATARVEEQENLTRFGDVYAEYMKTTKMFVPGMW